MFEMLKSLNDKGLLTVDHITRAETLGWITEEQALELSGDVSES